MTKAQKYGKKIENIMSVFTGTIRELDEVRQEMSKKGMKNLDKIGSLNNKVNTLKWENDGLEAEAVRINKLIDKLEEFTK